MDEAVNIAIVTGTSAGIGAATAKLLLEAGWAVIGMSRRSADFGHAAYQHIEADLGDIERLTVVAEHVISPALADDRWQRVGLVNNAAVAGDFRFLEEVVPTEMQKLFTINVVSPIWLMGFVTRAAPVSAALRIVNISSGAAVRPFEGAGDYGASKAALRLASMTFAAEITSEDRPAGPRRNVSVNSYSPGVVETEMQKALRVKNLPWTQMFVEYYEKGMLQPAEAPAREIVSFLSADGMKPFVEGRFGDHGRTHNEAR